LTNIIAFLIGSFVGIAGMVIMEILNVGDMIRGSFS